MNPASSPFERKIQWRQALGRELDEVLVSDVTKERERSSKGHHATPQEPDHPVTPTDGSGCSEPGRVLPVAEKAPGKNSQLIDLGSTLRTRTPEATLDAVRPHLQRFGITRLANVTGLDTIGIPVWVAIRPTARSVSVSQGKGVTDSLAKTSAAMEAIELSHGEVCVPDGSAHSIGDALRSSAFVDPRLLPIRSDVSVRENHVLSWIDATDYTTGESFKVPRELFDRDSLIAHTYDRVFNSSSNGLASGNSRDEAILHGLSEVVERDHAVFWTVSEALTDSQHGSRVDPESVVDPVCAGIIRQINRAGLKLAIWHASLGSEVPTFICSTWDEDHATIYPTHARGQGTHPYKRVALCRALTEAVQSRLTYISGARDDLFWSHYQKGLDIAGHTLFVENMKSAPMDVDYRDVPEAPPTTDVRRLLQWLIGRLTQDFGSRCLVVDLSDPELPFNVVQVIAPGLDVNLEMSSYTPTPRMVTYLRRKELV